MRRPFSLIRSGQEAAEGPDREPYEWLYKLGLNLSFGAGSCGRESGWGVTGDVGAGLPHAHTGEEEGASRGRVEAEKEQRSGIIFSATLMKQDERARRGRISGLKHRPRLL